MAMKQTISTRLLPLRFDADKLHTDLANLTEADWHSHFNTAVYQGDWSGAPLRAVPGSNNVIYSDPTADNWEDTPLLARCPYFQRVLKQFACPLLSVRLLRLAPGAFIKEHRDYDLGLDVGEVRLHVVVTTNPEVECRIDGVPYHWAEAECWYADFGLTHFFANRGNTERVHMVLDCRVNEWLLALLAAGVTPVNQNIVASPPVTLEWLFLQTQSNSELRKRLFEITNTKDFIAVLGELANGVGLPFNPDEVQDIMRQNHRDWIERHLP